MSAAVLYILGALVTAVAPDFPIMVIGRFIFGIGIGLVMLSKHKFLFHLFPLTSAYAHKHTLLVIKCSIPKILFDA